MNTYEVNISIHFNVKFLEALGRIAEKISPCPIGENIDKWELV